MMRSLGARIATVVGTYAAGVGTLWGMMEAATYFTGEALREMLGPLWVLVFYGLPLVPAVAVAIRRTQPALSQAELDAFTAASVDPTPTGPIRRPFDNTGLSDAKLRQTIAQRNREGKPTYLLRMEYGRRLAQRRES